MLNPTLDNLYQQDTDIEIIKTLLPFLKHPTFIDVGAEKGSFTKFLNSYGLQGTFFEPLPKFAPELQLLAEATHCVFLPYAVDQIDRTADFFIAHDHENNLLDYFHSLQTLNNDARVTHKKTITVTCRSLNSLLAEKHLPKKVGIVKIDTEGNDLNVIKGMTELEPEILMCEYFMPGLYDGWEEGHPQGLIEEAAKLGFKHYMAIKRIDDYELVSMDIPAFINKQWGNLIFINDLLFDSAKKMLDQILVKKEIQLATAVSTQTKLLQKACDERLAIINQARITEPSKGLLWPLQNQLKRFFKKES